MCKELHASNKALRQRGPALASLLWLLTAACSSTRQPSARDVADANDTGATLEANDAGERALLARAPTLPSNRAQHLDANTQVFAEPAYAAASGRTCRALRLTIGAQKATNRLACTDGKAWFFVPDVFGASMNAEEN